MKNIIESFYYLNFIIQGFNNEKLHFTISFNKFNFVIERYFSAKRKKPEIVKKKITFSYKAPTSARVHDF